MQGSQAEEGSGEVLEYFQATPGVFKREAIKFVLLITIISSYLSSPKPLKMNKVKRKASLQIETQCTQNWDFKLWCLKNNEEIVFIFKSLSGKNAPSFASF